MTEQNPGVAEKKQGKFCFKCLSIAVVTLLVLTGGAVFFFKQVPKEEPVVITVYKSPTCDCCNKWVDHLTAAGFSVITHSTNDLGSIKLSTGVRPELQSCHTALVEGYVIEGHVPANDIKRLLQERLDIAGLAVPGMPIGSPGMEQGDYKMPYEVLTFNQDGHTEVFSSY